MTEKSELLETIFDKRLEIAFIICLFASISMCSISDDHYDYKMAELACGAE